MHELLSQTTQIASGTFHSLFGFANHLFNSITSTRWSDNDSKPEGGNREEAGQTTEHHNNLWVLVNQAERGKVS